MDWLNPAAEPSFLLQQNMATDSYLQFGGGRNALTVEWREVRGEVWRHWVAALPNGDPHARIQLPGHGRVFAIKADEKLTNEHARVILLAFAAHGARPLQFIWRDISAELGG